MKGSKKNFHQETKKRKERIKERYKIENIFRSCQQND